jgi:hypothetical protein
MYYEAIDIFESSKSAIVYAGLIWMDMKVSTARRKP